MSWRRLGELIVHLPRDSATRNELVGEKNDWGRLEHLVADLIDITQSWDWAIVGNKKNPRPKLVERPSDVTKRSKWSEAEREQRLLELAGRR